MLYIYSVTHIVALELILDRWNWYYLQQWPKFTWQNNCEISLLRSAKYLFKNRLETEHITQSTEGHGSLLYLSQNVCLSIGSYSPKWSNEWIQSLLSILTYGPLVLNHLYRIERFPRLCIKRVLCSSPSQALNTILHLDRIDQYILAISTSNAVLLNVGNPEYMINDHAKITGFTTSYIKFQVKILTRRV